MKRVSTNNELERNRVIMSRIAAFFICAPMVVAIGVWVYGVVTVLF